MSTRNEHKRLLRECGLRATPGRILMLAVLECAGKPLSAEQLHTQVRSVDLVTVYRTLQSFSAAGIAREVRFKDATVRYEFAHAHHHHLVCTTCGIIDELPECDVSLLEQQALKRAPQFATVEEHALEFFGTCVRCAKG